MTPLVVTDEQRRQTAISHGACKRCTTGPVVVWHHGKCPVEDA